MIHLKLKLQYSHETVNKPVLAELIAKTGLLVNILEAKVTTSQGEMVIDLPTQGNRVKEVVDYLRDSGVEVIELYSLIELDRSKCFSCGACISPCPTKALKFNDRFEVVVNETRCIGCRICAKACPIGAIKVY